MANISDTITNWSATAASNQPDSSDAATLQADLQAIQAAVKAFYDGSVTAVQPGGRLTLTTATPVTTGDVTGAETLYYTPYKGNKIALYDGSSAWKVYSFAELSIDVPDATNCYDVFAYDNAGAVALELTAWTNETTRATALTFQNGVYVKTGATTRRYLGTFYSTTAGNGQIEDSFAKRNLWNYYNRVERGMRVTEATDTWNYTIGTYRQANGSTANQLEFVIGVSEDAVEARVATVVQNTNTGVLVNVAIGLDSTTASSATEILPIDISAANLRLFVAAGYTGLPGVGRHTLVWLEISGATGTTSWYGDGGAPTRIQGGIRGKLLG